MFRLSNATAKGRTNTAGCTKLAVFFLACLFVFCGCPANASDSVNTQFPFVRDGKLYSFSPEEDSSSCVRLYEVFGVPEGYTQKAVSCSKKQGYILAWNSKTQNLYHINSSGQTGANIKLLGSIAYINQNYALVQNSNFSENKGFSFTLYSIKYSQNNKRINLKKIWNGSIDCFVSDCFFTEDGTCICGGTQDNSKHNVFYITANGIHKCFSTAKNSDFLRLLNTGDKVYAFLSGRDKTTVEPLLYSFTLEGYTEGTAAQMNLAGSGIPQNFECFFGYGFVSGGTALVLPASINGAVSFVCYDYKNNTISSVVPDAGGCIASLCSTEEGVYYIARDPLIEGSFYGIALFDGLECKKIKEF